MSQIYRLTLFSNTTHCKSNEKNEQWFKFQKVTPDSSPCLGLQLGKSDKEGAEE